MFIYLSSIIIEIIIMIFSSKNLFLSSMKKIKKIKILFLNHLLVTTQILLLLCFY